MVKIHHILTIVLVTLLIIALTMLIVHPLPYVPCIPAPIQFVHIPKTAGTAIEDAYAPLGWGRHEFPSLIHKLLPWKPTPWHSPEQIRKANNGRPSFCVIRDPFKRIISEYCYRCTQKHRLLTLPLNHGPTPTPKGLNDSILYWRERLNRFGPQLLDNHLRPYSAYAKDCTHVLTLGPRLSTDIATLVASYGVAAREIRRANESINPQGVDETDLTAENRKWVQSYYAEDFKMWKERTTPAETA